MNDGEYTPAKHNKQRDFEFASCARDFWHFMQFIQTEDEEREIFRPFPRDFEYLKQYHWDMENNQKTLTLKSRRMLISLYHIAKMLWRAKFAGMKLLDAKDVYYGGYSATDEDLAKYQFTRISAMHRSLPDWLKRRNPLTTDITLHMEFEGGGKIHGYPLKRQGPQGFGFSEFVFDEMAWQEAARSTWKGLIPTIGVGKVHAISTPNGRDGIGRVFHELWANVTGRHGGLYRTKVHWKENPEHDEDWYEMITTGLEPWEIEQMFEMSFVSFAGKPVWPKFNRENHVFDKTEIRTASPVYLGWDFGYHNPAFVFAQRNTRDQWVFHREYLKNDIEFDTFCNECKEFARSFYDQAITPEVHFVDPAGFHLYNSKTALGAISDVHAIKLIWERYDGADVIVRPGAMETGRQSAEGPRIKEVRKLWNLREGDGRYGLIINKLMEHFIDGCGGGYAYPEKGNIESPEKNIFSHVQDAVQMIVTGFNRYTNPGNYGKKKRSTKNVRRIGHRMGI